MQWANATDRQAECLALASHIGASEFSLLRNLTKSVPRSFYEHLGVVEGEPYTFFAPIDSALSIFKNDLGATAFERLISDSTAFERLIKYHIVKGVASLTTVLNNGSRLATALNHSAPLVVVKKDSAKLALVANQSTANTTDAPDIITCHGIMKGAYNLNAWCSLTTH